MVYIFKTRQLAESIVFFLLLNESSLPWWKWLLFIGILFGVTFKWGN